MEQFLSPLGQVIARKVQFVAGAICIVLLLLGLWDEDVLSVSFLHNFSHFRFSLMMAVLLFLLSYLFLQKKDSNLRFQAEDLNEFRN